MKAARYLLDTNICIAIHRKPTQALLEQFQALERGEAVISTITWGELRFGAEKSRQRDQVVKLLDEFVSLIPVAPLPATAGIAYGVIRAELEAQGRPIGNNDLWIAAHAKATGLTLVTDNGREFDRVTDLTVENWLRP